MIDPDEPGDDAPAPRPPFLLSAVRLVRLPNVFTAWADILLGYWLTVPVGDFGDGATLALLLGATTGLYLAGMALNDLCDLSVDARERPWRPLPAGLVSVRFAAALTAVLALAGLACAAFAGWRTLAVAGALAALVVGYNAWLKSTLLGPVAMGLCRGLNVLLAMTPGFGAAADFEPDDGTRAALFQTFWWWLVPTAAAVYVAGLTVFARDEAIHSRRVSLGLGYALLLAGLGLHAWGFASVAGADSPAWRIGAVLAAFLTFRCGLAIHSPSPYRVQRAVIVGILSLCLVAATWMVAVHGREHAMACACLMFPALLLGRWVSGT